MKRATSQRARCCVSVLMSDELFRGWRDPGDDAHRMLYYVRWTLGFFGGLGLVFYSLVLLFRKQGMEIQAPDDSISVKVLPFLLLPLGLLMMTLMGLRLYPEMQRLRGQKVTAETAVAGGLVLGAVLLGLGVERMTWSIAGSTRGEGVLWAGVVVLGLSMVAGFGFAFAPRFRGRARLWSGVVVEARYAIDRKLMEIDDHPDPFGEDCVAMVRLRTADGVELNLRASPGVYDLAAKGARGEARVAGTRLLSFRAAGR
jgi:hypothetical protein